MIYPSSVLCWFGFSIRALYGFLLIWLCEEYFGKSAQRYVRVSFFVSSHVITEHLWTTLANKLPHPDNVRVSKPRKIFSGFFQDFFVYLYCQSLHKSGCIFHGSRFNLKNIPFNFSTGQLRYIDKEMIKIINKHISVHFYK